MDLRKSAYQSLLILATLALAANPACEVNVEDGVTGQAPIDPIAELGPAPDASGLSRTIFVTSEEELRQAAALIVEANADSHETLNILIDREFTVSQGIRFRKSNWIVRLIGVNKEAGIRFNMVFGGDWGTYQSSAEFQENGLTFNCRQAIIRGLQFSGYEWKGAVIKGQTEELLSVSDCRFHDIGTIQFPHRVDPPADPYDTIYNQCIGAHKMSGGHISIVNCAFSRCVLNNRPWSHCIYVSARSVSVIGNTFTECGSPLAIGNKVPSSSNNLFANTVMSPQAVEDPVGGRLQTYLYVLSRLDSTAFMFNDIDGEHRGPWLGAPEPDSHHVIDFNDYSGMTYTGIWAYNSATGTGIPLADWRGLGFDNLSEQPTKLD